MRIVSVTPPASEPVSLVLQKQHSRVDINDDDTVLSGYIVASRLWCEQYCGIKCVTQTWDFFLDYWDDRPQVGSNGYYLSGGSRTGLTLYADWWRTNQIRLPITPVQTVTYINYIDPSGTSQVWGTDQYGFSSGTPARVFPLQNVFFPSIASQPDAIQIRTVCGFGTAEDVPQSIVSAILLVTDWLYNNRSAVSDVNWSEVPISAKSLLDSAGAGKLLFA